MLLSAGAAFAAEPAVEASGTALVTRLGGHTVTIPLPPWLSAAGPGETPFVYNAYEKNVEALTFRPAGETVVSWTQTMGVLVITRKGYGAEKQMASVIDPMVSFCVDGQLGLTPVKSERAGVADAVIIACGRYRLTSDAPNGCAAGFLVAAVRESWTGSMKVYDEWCSASFNLDDRASWPVKDSELLEIANRLQQVTTFEPLPRP